MIIAEWDGVYNLEVARLLNAFAWRVRGTMLDQGTPLPDMDALIAATALAGDLTLVTHNVADFQPVPDLRIEDWLA